MKIKIILIIVVWTVSATSVYAHQPSSMEISYSHEDEVLSTKIVHVTNKRNKHYVRKVEIVRMTGESQKINYVRQTHVRDIKKEIQIKLEPKEIIEIKVYCKKGGILKQDFVVPDIEDKENKELKKGD